MFCLWQCLLVFLVKLIAFAVHPQSKACVLYAIPHKCIVGKHTVYESVFVGHQSVTLNTHERMENM